MHWCEDTYDHYAKYNLHQLEFCRNKVYESYPNLDEGEAELVAMGMTILSANNYLIWPEDKK